MEAKKISNIHVTTSSYSKRASASWHADGVKFHVWFDIDTLKLDDDAVIYKNPLENTDRRGPDFFDTRKLSLDIPKNAETVRQVFEVIKRDGLIAKAVAFEKERERQRLAANKELKRQEKIKEAGPKLLKVLKDLTGKIEVMGGCKPEDFEGEEAWPEFERVTEILRDLGEDA